MAGIMLAAFALRMLIPPGFMPASGRPFLLEICADGLPAGLLTQLRPADADATDMDAMGMGSIGMGAMAMGDSASHQGPTPGTHHSGGPSQSEHCVFGTACSAGPIPHVAVPSGLHSGQPLRAVAFSSIAAAVCVVHLPQARAPPIRLG
jgi:hypothetical protein